MGALIAAGLFEGEISRRGQQQYKREMRRSGGQDDTDEQMNLPCRREAERHEPRPVAKFEFQILASCRAIKNGKNLTVKQKTFVLPPALITAGD
jgi:hypothetical protein